MVVFEKVGVVNDVWMLMFEVVSVVNNIYIWWWPEILQ